MLVVDGGGSMECALLGDNIASLAQEAGWAGIVLNACVRDTVALDELGPRRQGAGLEPAAEPEGRRRRDRRSGDLRRRHFHARRAALRRRGRRHRAAAMSARARPLGDRNRGARRLAGRGRGRVRRDDELGALPGRRRAAARRARASLAALPRSQDLGDDLERDLGRRLAAQVEADRAANAVGQVSELLAPLLLRALRAERADVERAALDACAQRGRSSRSSCTSETTAVSASTSISSG